MVKRKLLEKEDALNKGTGSFLVRFPSVFEASFFLHVHTVAGQYAAIVVPSMNSAVSLICTGRKRAIMPQMVRLSSFWGNDWMCDSDSTVCARQRRAEYFPTNYSRALPYFRVDISGGKVLV